MGTVLLAFAVPLRSITFVFGMRDSQIAFSLPLTLNPSEPMMPYECHEGNYGLKNILSAARADDAKAAAAKE